MSDSDANVSAFPANSAASLAERLACLLELIAAHAVQLEETASSFGGGGAEDDSLLFLRLRDGVRLIGYMADKGLGVAGRPQVHGDADAWLLPPVWHKAGRGTGSEA